MNAIAPPGDDEPGRPDASQREVRRLLAAQGHDMQSALRVLTTALVETADRNAPSARAAAMAISRVGYRLLDRARQRRIACTAAEEWPPDD